MPPVLPAPHQHMPGESLIRYMPPIRLITQTSFLWATKPLGGHAGHRSTLSSHRLQITRWIRLIQKKRAGGDGGHGQRGGWAMCRGVCPECREGLASPPRAAGSLAPSLRPSER